MAFSLPPVAVVLLLVPHLCFPSPLSYLPVSPNGLSLYKIM